MQPLEVLKSLIIENKTAEALKQLEQCELLYNKQDFSIQRLEHDKWTIQHFLNNTIIDLEDAHKEAEALRKAEEQSKDELIRATQYHLDRIINEISSGLAFLDFNLQYVLANQSYLQWVDKTYEEVKGRAMISIIGKNRFIELREVIQRALKGERSDIETSFLDHNNKRVFISASYIPSFNTKREVNGVYIFEQDITLLKNNEIILEEKNTELQSYIESNLQLENFAHIASHDLKAPLNSIDNFAELLSNTAYEKLSDTEKKFLDYIKKGSENMKSTIASLLNFSLATNQKAIFKTYDLNLILEELIKDISVTIHEKSAKIIIHEMPAAFYCDKHLIRQLFQNLILNAIKFSKEGIEPIVEIHCDNLNKYWKITVKDNGIGIPTEYFEKIFVLFQRLHTQKKFEGTGIGLATCKKIVELHGGSIGVESEEGKGSRFIFTVKKPS